MKQVWTLNSQKDSPRKEKKWKNCSSSKDRRLGEGPMATYTKAEGGAGEFSLVHVPPLPLASHTFPPF